MRLAIISVRLAVLALLLGSLATAAAQVTWHAMGESDVLPPRPILSATRTEPAAPPDTSAILALAPFGRIDAPTPVAQEARRTSLDLILSGVVIDDDPARSTAFISSDRVMAGFRPGDDIAGKAILLAVEASQVLLDVGGAQEILTFPDANVPASADTAMTGLERLSLATSGSAATPEPPKTTEDHIDYWRDRIRANPGEVLAEIGLIATEQGYIIADRHDSGVRKAGLRAGDIVTRVNGQQVGDVERDRKLYDQIAESGQARIEVARGDRTIVMSFPLR